MERGVSEANGGGGKRKIDDEIELAKQKAQAIAARFLNDADAKRPRTGFDSAPPPSSFSSSQPSFPVSYATQTSQYNGVPSSKKIHIPNAKVGVIIGRGGDMIKNLQQRSGARIQITRDADADPTSLTRDVELVGTQEQISRAEELINEVIAETDAASSVSSGNRGGAPLQPGSEQFVMKVPNDKVALVIGKGGETIKSMQNKSGARIQVVPLHLAPGDTSTERNVFINGTKEQIEAAKELVNEVISGNRLKVLSGTSTYNQSTYASGTGWPPQGQPAAQQPPAYGYTQPGGYAMPPPPYYGGYPSQPAGWEQQTNPAAAPTQQQNTGYNAYGQSQPTSTPPNVNYNYSQMPQATGYSYNQGYAQQPPSYGQDVFGQAQTPDQAKSYANPAYGPQATSSQPDGTPAVQTSQPVYATPAVQAPQPGYGTPTVQSSQPGYGTPGAQSSQPQPGYGTPAGSDGTAQSQPPSTYATSYGQPAAAPANGYTAYPSYSTPPSVQPAYSQSGYSQMAYGQQQEVQVSNQASYSYYGQGGYPPTQAPGQSGYYQGAYPQAPPPQAPPQTQAQDTNGVPQSVSYGAERADGGDPITGSGGDAAADESENLQS